jgi:hypothetical protein
MVQTLQKKVMSPLSSFVVQWPIDLFVFVVVVANDVVIVGNVVDLQWSPSNLHIHHRQSADAPHPLESLCHVPS